MDWKERIIAAWNCLPKNPDVIWSGWGLMAVSTGIAGIGFVCSKFYACLRKPKISSTPQDASEWLAKNRQAQLDELQRKLNTRLYSFLLCRKSLELEKTLSPDQVHHPHTIWDSLTCTLERDNAADETTDQSVAALFHRPDVGEQLAILGKPGSGKTVSLLKLAEHLLQKAEKKPSAPLPVVFECSEWDGRELYLWMAAQLHRKYSFPEDTARQLVQERDILPLFDGLDELASEKQGDFVRFFNTFADGRSLAICCREQEYRHFQEKTGQKLALNTAVLLHDIAEEKLAAHLHQEGLDDLWSLLKQSEIEAGQSSTAPAAGQPISVPPQSLLRLAQRPLFLGLMIAVTDELRQGSRIRQGETWEDCILRLYLDYCLQEKQSDRNQSPDCYGKKYSKEQSLHWLRCLAKWMQAEQKVELRIDELQPTMIQNYWPFGLLYVLIYVLFFELIGLLSKRNAALGVLLGLEVGLFSLLYFFRKIFSANLARYMLIAMSVTYFSGLVFELVKAQKSETRQLLAVMIAVGFLAAFFDRLLKGLKFIKSHLGESINIKELLYDVLRNSLLLFPVLTFISMIVFVPFILLAEQIRDAIGLSFEKNIFYLVLVYIVVSNIFVLKAEDALQRYLLRLYLWLERQLPLRLGSWLKAMQQRKVLQRVGGSYHFLHKQLQEYLAKQIEMEERTF